MEKYIKDEIKFLESPYGQKIRKPESIKEQYKTLILTYTEPSNLINNIRRFYFILSKTKSLSTLSTTKLTKIVNVWYAMLMNKHQSKDQTDIYQLFKQFINDMDNEFSNNKNSNYYDTKLLNKYNLNRIYSNFENNTKIELLKNSANEKYMKIIESPENTYLTGVQSYYKLRKGNTTIFLFGERHQTRQACYDQKLSSPHTILLIEDLLQQIFDTTPVFIDFYLESAVFLSDFNKTYKVRNTENIDAIYKKLVDTKSQSICWKDDEHKNQNNKKLKKITKDNFHLLDNDAFDIKHCTTRFHLIDIRQNTKLTNDVNKFTHLKVFMNQTRFDEFISLHKEQNWLNDSSFEIHQKMGPYINNKYNNFKKKYINETKSLLSVLFSDFNYDVLKNIQDITNYRDLFQNIVSIIIKNETSYIGKEFTKSLKFSPDINKASLMFSKIFEIQQEKIPFSQFKSCIQGLYRNFKSFKKVITEDNSDEIYNVCTFSIPYTETMGSLTDYMVDMYTIARIQKVFLHPTVNTDQPTTPSNIIIYAGLFHIQNFYNYFYNIQKFRIMDELTSNDNCLKVSDLRQTLNLMSDSKNPLK
jgi:hypothetical protein